MKLYELSQIPFKERFRLVNEIKARNTEFFPDIRIVSEIFDDTINWFQKPSNQSDPILGQKLETDKEELPSFFETIYEIMEGSKIKELPDHERQRIFDESKDAWRLHYPEFNRIYEIMLKYKSNEMLMEFQKCSPPLFIYEKAGEVYKKCLSYKVKLKRHKMKSLGYSYTPGPFCIDRTKVKFFTDEYADWGRKASVLWNEIYSLRDKYESLYSYEDWKWYIKHSDLLKDKADKIQEIQEEALSLLNYGIEMLIKYDEEITLEYNAHSTEMSFYERELEILQISEDESASDEEYCYVYTLDCELFVFYVGIAANPSERFEQHLRGAFSDEFHLFKSKFIQKYHNEVKQKIIFEGTRRECKQFERAYIAKHSPLGNMTQGGEG